MSVRQARAVERKQKYLIKNQIVEEKTSSFS
jgi:hypothetical protein